MVIPLSNFVQAMQSMDFFGFFCVAEKKELPREGSALYLYLVMQLKNQRRPRKHHCQTHSADIRAQHQSKPGLEPL